MIDIMSIMTLLDNLDPRQNPLLPTPDTKDSMNEMLYRNQIRVETVLCVLDKHDAATGSLCMKAQRILACIKVERKKWK